MPCVCICLQMFRKKSARRPYKGDDYSVKVTYIVAVSAEKTGSFWSQEKKEAPDETKRGLRDLDATESPMPWACAEDDLITWVRNRIDRGEVDAQYLGVHPPRLSTSAPGRRSSPR